MPALKCAFGSRAALYFPMLITLHCGMRGEAVCQIIPAVWVICPGTWSRRGQIGGSRWPAIIRRYIGSILARIAGNMDGFLGVAGLDLFWFSRLR